MSSSILFLRSSTGYDSSRRDKPFFMVSVEDLLEVRTFTLASAYRGEGQYHDTYGQLRLQEPEPREVFSLQYIASIKYCLSAVKMDVLTAIAEGDIGSGVMVRTVDMHTSGEATRIVLPVDTSSAMHKVIFQGKTLLEKRTYAKEHLDWLRQRVMREPRGHEEMYGAILIAETELTQRNEADMGVLFCHNEGYSTMCGHATIALGRFLVDTQDANVFPRRSELSYIAERQETAIRLHVPCGIVHVSVPTIIEGPHLGKSDPKRQVSFESVPSFVSATNVRVFIPPEERWKALKHASRAEVTVDVAFGGAYYAIVDVTVLGFSGGIQQNAIEDLNEATRTLKKILKGKRELYTHPDEADLEYLYGVIVTEKLGYRRELGICFFANQQIDRSPTGSGVSARIALAVEQGCLEIGDEMRFESIVSIGGNGMGFSGMGTERVSLTDKDGNTRRAVRVCVKGQAFYTGAHSFVAEEGDELGNGFEVNTRVALFGRE